MRAEDFFPMDWLGKRFRRQPYPDMTYRDALLTAKVTFWNMRDNDEAEQLSWQLEDVHRHMGTEHADFKGRSIQPVADFNELWRGKVTTLLKWFTTSGGTT